MQHKKILGILVVIIIASQIIFGSVAYGSGVYADVVFYLILAGILIFFLGVPFYAIYIKRDFENVQALKDFVKKLQLLSISLFFYTLFIEAMVVGAVGLLAY